MKSIVLAALLASGAAGAASPCDPIAQRIPFAPEVTERAPATAQVRALFDAASEGDEAAFARLLVTVPNINDYQIDGDRLLHRLLRPAASLRADEAAWRDKFVGRGDGAHWAGQQRKHAALYAAKTRMLALALKAGAAANEAGDDGPAPLHLAALYGTADMVKMLIAAGADVSQVGGYRAQYEPLEIALQQDAADRMENIVTPEERTAVVLALLDAGAPLPGRQLQALSDCRHKERNEKGWTIDRPFADFHWGPLLALTRGRTVLDRMMALGTKPYIDDGAAPLFAYAAVAGNVEGVAWLKDHVPRFEKDGKDLWVEGAIWALQAPRDASDRILDALLVPDLRWAQKGPAHFDTHSRAWRHVPHNEQNEATLLGRAIVAGRDDVVRRLVKLGAPVTAADAALLAHAVAAGNVGMVRTLLALGVSPLSGETPALEVAVLMPEDMTYKGLGDNAELTLAQRTDMLAMLLEALRQQKLAVPEDSLLLERALKYATTIERARLAHMALDAGVPVSGVGGRGARDALRSPDRTLFGKLLAHGFLANSDERADGAGYSVREALLAGRKDVLPALLALGPNLAWRDDDGVGPVDVAIRQGDIGVIESLLAAGGKLDAEAFDSAIASGHADVVRFVAARTGLPIGTQCNGKADALARMLRKADDAYWSMLREQGFGARSCPDLARRLAEAYARGEPILYAGWVGERMRRRMADLYADNPGKATNDATAKLLRTPRNATLAAVLRGAGWPAPAAADLADKRTPARRAADLALAKKLPGDYDGSGHELATGIRLQRDGTFLYMLTYGAMDEEQQGRWTVKDGRLYLTSVPVATKTLYTPFEEAKAAQPGKLAVAVYFRDRPIPGLRIAALGDEPAQAMGLSAETGWDADWTGPVRQIVIAHDELDDGRPFVFDVPQEKANATRFAFRLPDNVPGRTFEAQLSIRGTSLVWSREEGEFVYKRTRAQAKP
jgi:ankyrin repeat protein